MDADGPTLYTVIRVNKHGYAFTLAESHGEQTEADVLYLLRKLKMVDYSFDQEWVKFESKLCYIRILLADDLVSVVGWAKRLGERLASRLTKA